MAKPQRRFPRSGKDCTPPRARLRRALPEPHPLDIPDFLRIPQSVRNQWWIDHPPVAMPLFAPTPRDVDPETAAIAAQIEQERKTKSLAKLKRSLERKAQREAMPSLKTHRWDPTRNKFVRDARFLATQSINERAAATTPAKAVKSSIDVSKPRAAPRSTKNLDPIAQALLDCDTVAKLQKVGKANGVWDDKYLKLPNPGLVRMNIGNRLRAKHRRGEKVVL